ncbi:MAG: MBL fold metallo-hydrolase [Synergistaceae bacterium]|jgi:glyoxylase-like metal-dependent hydrolase (beta-lactamase superfamily II)|nr:MBL fold metallo-hydrolase [Synergistaceae bacterium]
MQKLRYHLMFCVLFSILLITCGEALAAEAEKYRVEMYTVGEATVWAIADSTGDRERTVFPSADPGVLDEYMPSGGSPSAIMAFLVKTENETLLVDTGFGALSGSNASQLMGGLAQVGVTPEGITLVLLTHMHTDHVGGLIWDSKKAFPAARVLSSRTERDFWLDEKLLDRFPDRRVNLEMVRNTFSMYGDAMQVFEYGDAVAPGITALDSHGHTPGHTSFLLESKGERMLFWGDLIHAAALQFPNPDINAVYDMNPEDAAAARANFMEKAAVEKFLIAGAHLPFPGVGTVEKADRGYVYRSR